MRRRKNGGFILLMLVILLGLVGLYMLILSGITRSMQDQTSEMLLQARLDGAVQSGVAYVRANPEMMGELELDGERFKNCSVKIEHIDGVKVVNVKCTVAGVSKSLKLRVDRNE